MLDRILLVALTGAATRLEAFPGEFFPRDRFQFEGLSYDDYIKHPKHWINQKKICLMHFTFLRCPDLDLSVFDLVLIIDEECVDSDCDVYLSKLHKKLNNTNICIITSGYHRDYPPDPKRIYVFPFFLMSMSLLTKRVSINPLENHAKKFDVLLGMDKPHRKFVFYQLKKHNMLSECYVNLTTNRWHEELKTLYRSEDLDLAEVPEIENYCDGVIDSYGHINGTGPRISHIMPWQIYDQSLYSVVAETNWCEYIFLSEKTAKALLARRIFVFFGTHGTMDFIRKLGFRTFDEIFDESYDDTQDDQQRFQKAWQQMLWLRQADPHEIYRRCENIVNHNYNHISNRRYFIDPLKRWIDQLIDAC